MKRLMLFATVLCLLTGCLSVAACATTNSGNITDAEVLQKVAEDAYAVITDEEGKIIDYLDVDVSVKQVKGGKRDTGTTYALTYTARTVKSDTDATGPVDGVTATGTITWNDIKGTTNSLVSVSGLWTVGDEAIYDRTVKYGAKDTGGNVLESFTKNPDGDDFHYEPSNCTGYLFYLNTSAKVVGTGNYIRLYVQTSIFT